MRPILPGRAPRRADAGNERTTRLFNVHYRAASLTESAKRR
jgi:hypothetical protein